MFYFGLFESCVLTCGAVLERCFKLEYQKIHGKLPSGQWTLGQCIYKLDWEGSRVTKEILNIADECLDSRNSRAHALLEHADPQTALAGGNRGINFLDSGHYTIEPYRGDAEKVVSNTWQVLQKLYSGYDRVSGEA